MSRSFLDFSSVTFFYDTSGSPVFRELTLRLHDGFTAVVGANGAGKTTLLRLAAGELRPDRGEVRAPGPAVYCAQRTDDPPEGIDGLLDADDRRAHSLRGRLGVDGEMVARWDTLSHGERKRVQIAVALWRDPAVLLLDEPTNHVDGEGRRVLSAALGGYRGVGLLVSHDRELLSVLTRRTLFVTGGAVDLRSGSYGEAREQREREEEEVRRQHRRERRELRRLDAEADRRKRKAEQVSRGLSKRKVGGKDRSAKERIDRARVTGADAKAMKRAHQLDGRRRQVEERMAGLDPTKERRLGITVPGERSRRNVLFEVPAGSLSLPDGREVSHPRLRIGPGDRIGVTGPNGAGKTTLVRFVLDRLDLPEGRLVYLPQELTAERGAEVAEELRRLPRGRRGHVASVVSRLGSDPERVLETALPSPGETRKLLLALGMAGRPWLLVMDEPTNHLDLPSVECLETTLADFPGALLLVSHDREFLSRCARTRWRMESGAVEVRRGFAEKR